MDERAPGSFGEARVDLDGSSGPPAGCGLARRGGSEAGLGLVSVVRPPAAAPGGPGCAEAGAELGPCGLKQQEKLHLKKNNTIHGQKVGVGVGGGISAYSSNKPSM